MGTRRWAADAVAGARAPDAARRAVVWALAAAVLADPVLADPVLADHGANSGAHGPAECGVAGDGGHGAARPAAPRPQRRLDHQTPPGPLRPSVFPALAEPRRHIGRPVGQNDACAGPPD